MSHLDLDFIDAILDASLFEAYFLLEINSKKGRHRKTGVNKLSIHENNGLQMLKIHKDYEVVLTLPRNAMPNLSLHVEVHPTYPGAWRPRVPVRASASICDLKSNPVGKTFSFTLRPAHFAHGKGPRPAEDPNAFMVLFRLSNAEGQVLNVSTLYFGAFANPNSKERERRGLSVVPCFLDSGLSTLTETSKEEFLRRAVFPGSVPTALPLPEEHHDDSPPPPSSSSSSSSSSDAAMEVDYFGEGLLSPYEFINSPFPDQF